MRKTFTLLLAGAAIAASSGAAMASSVRIGVSVGFPAPYIYSPPVVVAPAPVYYPPRVVYAPPRVVYGPRVVVAPAPWWVYRHGYGRYWDHAHRRW